MERLNQDANQDKANDPTANYRAYTKGPNFLLIVLLACASFLIVLLLAYIFVHHAEKKMPAHTPDPTPNSLIQRVTPTPTVA